MDIGHCLRMMNTVEVTEKLSAWEIVRKSEKVCDSVAQWLGRWTCNQQVAGSTPDRRIAE